jgi:phosphotransferase system  glucose/maltose/N-acetylglucosamine-specific IIC component
VTLQGVASSGATVAYASANGSPVSTTADATGNYKITVPLAAGANTFTVTSTDSFGQTISGTIAAITYKPLST